MTLTQIVRLVKDAAMQWSNHKAAQLAAALAFYSILSIGPLLLIAISLASLAFGHAAASGRIVHEIQGVVGPQAAEAIEIILANSHQDGSGFIAASIGLATLLFGASGVFGQLQSALNTIWEAKPDPGKPFYILIRQRALSFAMVLCIGFLLLVSLLVSTALAAAGKFFTGALPQAAPLLEGINFLATFAIASLLFAMIFKILPDARIAWRDVWAGAVLTSALFAVGKVLIGLYLGRASLSSAYGAAGSLVALSVWVYYSALILFFGAEIAHAYAVQRAGRDRF